MKFIVQLSVVRVRDFGDSPATRSEEFKGPYDTLHEAELVASEYLGLKERRGIYSPTTTRYTRVVIYPLRDGVEYRAGITKVYDFSGGAE